MIASGGCSGAGAGVALSMLNATSFVTGPSTGLRQTGHHLGAYSIALVLLLQDLQ